MPKNNRIISILMSIVTAFLLLMMFIPESASAYSTTSLICLSDDRPVPGMNWKIYRVGEVKDNEFVLTGDFKNYPVSLTDLTTENINGTAKALESFVIGDSLQFLSECDTNENGTASFSSLEPGLYLAIAKSVKIEKEIFHASPLLFEVKDSYDGENKIFPKMSSTFSSTVAYTKYTVKKVWVDKEEGDINRPVYVTVDLYKDGTLMDTVTLNEETNWQYKWEELDPEAEWRVVEREIPVKYDVLIDYNSTQYLIKNTYNPNRITGNGEGTLTTSATTSNLTTTNTNTTTTTATTAALMSTDKKSTLPSSTTAPATSEPKLPQTGQLWWPILPLSAGGIILIIAGLLIPKRKNDEE